MNNLKFVLSFYFMTLFWLPIMAQSMSDQEVLSYVKQSIAEGKEQRTITMDLARKGVTRQQAERVKKLYESQEGGEITKLNETRLNDSRLRNRIEKKDSTIFSNINKAFAADQIRDDQVFGRNIFNSKYLTFEPSVNISTPLNYRLGPGDEVIIDIWGTSQNSIRKQISPDGTINIEKIGPVNINGMTVSGANKYLKNVLAKTYSGLNSEGGELQISLTLGNTRTIQVNIMGEVLQPGTYALSSFASVFHALYRAGGVSPIGSLRNVHLVRNGKKITEIDVYDFIMKGKLQDDIRLDEGDVVIVPAYENMVKISGRIKRPMKFEMKKDETLASLLKYAGGFESDAYTKSLRIVRQNGEEYEVNTVNELNYNIYKMRNGDVVTVDAILKRFTNKLEIRGAVYRPGIYQLNGAINTIRTLVNEAQGLKGDAFTNRAVLQRERKNMTSEILSIDVLGIMKGTAPDVALKKNDVLYIPSIHDLEEQGNLSISGEIKNPGNFPFSDNMSLEDLLILAGGLRESASLARVDVSRRIKDPMSTEYTDSISQLFSFSIKDGFVIEGEQGFILKPYDQIMVRRSPGYKEQQNVMVTGEVLFEGTYSMTHRGERLSDLLRKAGGSTPKAYLKGAKLTRVANATERKRMEDVIKLMNAQFGEKMVDSLGIQVEKTFTVGIDLEAAVNKPGGKDDLILREGDVLSIPVLDNTVKINGAVMMPNTVAYKKGENVKYYLNQAGGYGLNAKRTKKFIIYMNGQIARVGNSDISKIEPGCEIFVPSKNKRNTSVGEILGYASSIGSIATMFATIGNLLK